jgi:spermidine/putrescine transport system substrate-binding protein
MSTLLSDGARSLVGRRRFLAQIGAGAVFAGIPGTVRSMAEGGGPVLLVDDPLRADPFLYETSYALGTSGPSLSLIAQGERGAEKLLAGTRFDVAWIRSADCPRWRMASAIKAIDVARLLAWPNLMDGLKDAPFGKTEGEAFIVPMTWGATTYAYRQDVNGLDRGEESWAVLWDKRNAGKIAIGNDPEQMWRIGMAYTGVTSADGEKGIEEVAKSLGLLLGSAHAVRAGDPSLAAYLATGDIVVAMVDHDEVRALEGPMTKIARPTEGIPLWSDGLVLASRPASPNEEAAFALLHELSSGTIGRAAQAKGNSSRMSNESSELLSEWTRSASPAFAAPIDFNQAERITREWDRLQSVLDYASRCNCSGPKGLLHTR